MKKDYFSTQADAYRTFRPGYPEVLFGTLCREIPTGATAWDCATGNGQAAVMLAEHVGRVVASDQSARQLAHATPHDRVAYVRAYAEAMPLADRSVDLVTVAQALHWFDFDRFYDEVRRVLKPGGLIAAWTYSFLSVTPQLGAGVDRVVRWFYHDIVGPYWPPERRWVDEQYRTIPFPFDPVDLPCCAIDVEWDMAAVVGYIRSWSATERCAAATGSDPVRLLVDRLEKVWGEPEQTRRLRWSLGLRCGRA
jgi:SAM-dependent methyltransferase